MSQGAAITKKKKKKTSSSGGGLFGMFRKKKKTKLPASVVTEAEMALEWDSPSMSKKKMRNETVEQEVKSVPSPAKSKGPKASSWFCRTKYFSQMCDSAFTAIDADGSGSVDAKELYSGLLLIHLKLGTYAGPAACRPLSRERAETVFHKFDVDGSGTLDKEEFRNVMTVLFGNVFFRVLVQWTLTLLVVPMVAQAFLDGVVWAWTFGVSTIQNLDEHSEVANQIELSLEGAASWCSNITGIGSYSEKIGEYLEMVPASVWEAIPLGLISTILGIVVIPWSIFQVDDFFQRVADKKSKEE